MDNNKDHLREAEDTGQKLEQIGGYIIRYGLVLILLWIGFLKFTPYEAKGIQPLVAHSPFMGWAYSIFSVQGMAILIGIVEILIAILIAIYRIAPALSAIGSYGAIVMAIITLSFLLSTPGMIQSGYNFPFLSAMPGQFVVKDFLLLGAAVWTAGKSRRLAATV